MSQNFSFRQAAVIGAGTMGRGIVMCPVSYTHL